MEGKRVRAAVGLVVAVGLATWGVGCRGRGRESVHGMEPTSAFSIVDALGREVRLEEAPDRLISLAPSITEILFALGLGEKVVGVTTWDNYPPEVARVERVGDYGNPNLEKIVWLEADLVLVTYGVPKPSIEALERQGIPVLALPDDSLEDVVRSVRMMGEACAAKQQGEQLASSLEQRIGAVSARAQVPGAARPKVLFLVSLMPLMCAAADTFIDDMISKAGGVNLGAKFGSDYPNLSAEAVLEEKPDVLFLGEYAGKGGGRQVLGRVGLSGCRTYTLPDDLVQRPGPRAVEGLELMAKALHPEIFGPLAGGYHSGQ